MEQVTITVQDVSKETIQSPKTGKDLDKLVIVSTDGDVYTGFQNQGDPKIGETISLKFKTFNTQNGQVRSIVDLGGKTQQAKKFNRANTAAPTARRASESAVNQAQGSISKVDKTTKDLSQEVSGIIQALLNTGLYTTTNKTDKGTFVNLNKVALDTHTRDVLAIKALIMKDNS